MEIPFRSDENTKIQYQLWVFFCVGFLTKYTVTVDDLIALEKKFRFNKNPNFMIDKHDVIFNSSVDLC